MSEYKGLSYMEKWAKCTPDPKKVPLFFDWGIYWMSIEEKEEKKEGDE